MEQKLQYISRLSGTQKYILSQYASELNEPWCYHTQFSYHLKVSDLSLPLFFKAVKGVLDRHPVFKTVMIFNGGAEVKQGINSGLDIQIQFSNIEHLDVAAQKGWIDAFLLDDRTRPFNVYDPAQPLCRIYVVKRGKDTLQFILVLMHAIWDGWSLALLLKEVIEYYHNLKSNPVLSLSAALYDYPEFLEHDETVSYDLRAKAFWKKHLEKHQPFVVSRRNVDKQYSYYKPVERGISLELSSKLQQMQPVLRVTVKAIYLAMFMRMIEDQTGQGYVTIGVVTNGRSLELSNPLETFGLLWNFAPVCMESVQGDVDQIRSVNRTLADIAVFGSYSLLNIQEDRGVGELIHAAFNFINFEGVDLLPPNSDVEFLEVGGLDKFHFPLHLLVGKNPFNKNISLVMNYDTRIYSENEIESMLDKYVERLEALAAVKV